MAGLAGIRFIDESPFAQGYSDRAGSLTRQRASEVQADRAQYELDEAQRARAEAEASDKAMREAVLSRTSPVAPAPATAAPVLAPLHAQPMPVAPQGEAAAPAAAAPAPSPAPASAPVAPAVQPTSLHGDAAARLARTKGGGARAFALLEAQQKQQDQWEEMAVKALGVGDLETFRYYQAKSGLQIPPDVLQSAEARANFARALDIAKTNYRDDPAQGQQFAQMFMSTPGDFQAKLMAAAEKVGPPRSKPNWTATTVYQNGVGVLAFYDANSREQPQVNVTGIQNHKGAEPNFSPQPIVRDDGSTGVGAFNVRTGEVKDTGTKMAARPSGGASKNMLVKIGQNSGMLYDAAHEGPGQDGEAVIVLPAAEASRLAIAKGNNATRERIATITGDYGLARQDMTNQGRVQAIDAKGGWDSALTDQRGQNALELQGKRNEGAMAVAEKRAQGGAGGRSSAWMQQFQARKAANPGMSDAEIIAQMDTGKAPHEKALWQKAVMQAAREQDMMGKAVNDTPEKLQAAAERMVQAYQKGVGGVTNLGAQTLPPPAQPQPAAPAPVSARPVAQQVVTQLAPGQNAGAPVGTRENPMVPKTQADIDNAPPGTVFNVNGRLMVK